MNLVEYSPSSSESETPSPPQSRCLKRKRTKEEIQPETTPPSSKSTSLPPLPSSFHNLYAAAARISTHDDPSLHGGRKRIGPHVEGNWPTHVYLECKSPPGETTPSNIHQPQKSLHLHATADLRLTQYRGYPSPTELPPLSSLLSTLNPPPPSPHSSTGSTLHSLLTSDLSVPLPLHISLSRPLSLSSPQRQPFLDKLTRSLKQCRARPFTVTFTGVDWAGNESSTRWFLVLRVSRPENDDLNRLLGVCNEVVGAFGAPGLYHETALSHYETALSTEHGGTMQRRRRGSRSGRGARVVLDSGHVPISGGLSPALCDSTEFFHVSIGWVLDSPLQRGERLELTREVSKLNVGFDTVKVKIGNTVTSISLSSEVVDNKGILG